MRHGPPGDGDHATTTRHSNVEQSKRKGNAQKTVLEETFVFEVLVDRATRFGGKVNTSLDGRRRTWRETVVVKLKVDSGGGVRVDYVTTMARMRPVAPSCRAHG